MNPAAIREHAYKMRLRNAKARLDATNETMADILQRYRRHPAAKRKAIVEFWQSVEADKNLLQEAEELHIHVRRTPPARTRKMGGHTKSSLQTSHQGKGGNRAKNTYTDDQKAGTQLRILPD